MGKVQDYGLEISEFEPQSPSYFQINNTLIGTLFILSDKA